jgi:hypothetical protein
MTGLETAFDVVAALVKGGPAAAWELIKEKLTNLKDMVIDGITSFVVDTIVKKAIPKIISMFIPGAGFISAIISIYDTVMVFVEKLAKLAAAVKAFVDSIVAIAAGQIEGAANKVENTLAGLLSLAISFLAGFLGLGNIASKVLAVIEKIRAAVDKALDVAIAWVVGKAKALFAKLFGNKEKPDDRTDQQKQADLDSAVSEAEGLMAKPDADQDSVRSGLATIKTKYKLSSIELVRDSQEETRETDHVVAQINPQKASKPKSFLSKMPECKALFTHKEYDVDEYSRQLRTAQQTIWKMKIAEWIGARDAFMDRFKKTGSGRDPKSAGYQDEFRRQNKQAWITQRAAALKKPPNALSSNDDAAKKANEDWDEQAALHPLDQVAGGGPKPTDMGDSRINSSIGSTWRSQVAGIYAVADKVSPKDQTKWNMNVTIVLDGSPV